MEKQEFIGTAAVIAVSIITFIVRIIMTSRG